MLLIAEYNYLNPSKLSKISSNYRNFYCIFMKYMLQWEG